MTHTEIEIIRDRFNHATSLASDLKIMSEFIKNDASRLLIEIHQLNKQIENLKLDNEKLQSRLK